MGYKLLKSFKSSAKIMEHFIWTLTTKMVYFVWWQWMNKDWPWKSGGCEDDLKIPPIVPPPGPPLPPAIMQAADPMSISCWAMAVMDAAFGDDKDVEAVTSGFLPTIRSMIRSSSQFE